MDGLNSVNYLDLCAIPDLCNKNFFIPEYQRGYRWGDVQIRQLLEDIYSFIYNKNASGNFYCLQPVVVKKMTEEEVASMACIRMMTITRGMRLLMVNSDLPQ